MPPHGNLPVLHVLHLILRKIRPRMLIQYLLFFLFIFFLYPRRPPPPLPSYKRCSSKDPSIHPDRLLADGLECLPPVPPPDFLRRPLPSNSVFLDCASSLRLVTAADGSELFYSLLLNLIGSVQFWEPHVPIAVYDLGFSLAQRAQLETLVNVQVVPMPFAKLPAHISDLSTYGFKGLAWLDATRRFSQDCFLWQDAGQELRRPLMHIRDTLTKDSLFLGKSSKVFPLPITKTHPLTLAFFGLDLPAAHKQMAVRKAYNRSVAEVAAGIVGWTRRQGVVSSLLTPFAACCLLPDCVAPPGTNRSNSMQDQSALNIILFLRRWPGEDVPPLPLLGQFVRDPIEADETIVWRRPPADDETRPSAKFETVSRKRDKSNARPYIRHLKTRKV